MTRMVAISIQVVSPLLTVAAASAVPAGRRPPSKRPRPRPAALRREKSLNVIAISLIGIPLQRVTAGLAGSDAHRLFERQHEDLSVADLAGFAGSADGLDDAGRQPLIDGDLDLHLGHEAHGIFGAAVEFGVPALAAMPFGFGDGDPLDADRPQGLADLVQLVWFDDGNDILHAPISLMLQRSS